MKISGDIDAVDGEDYKVNITLPEIRYDLSEFLIHKSDGVIFLYKPPLMHTERQTPLDSLCLDDLLKGDLLEYRLISRLDYGVDGVVAALHKGVNAEYEQKNYYAWVKGDFPNEYSGNWSIDADKRRKVAVKETKNGGKIDFRSLKRSNGYTLLEVILASAERHKVRAVCAHIGYPIAGDPLYGNNDEWDSEELTLKLRQRIGLHCCKAAVNGIGAVSPYKDSFEVLY